MFHRILIALISISVLASSVPVQEEATPVGPTAWFAVVHCAPSAGVLHVSLANGVQGQAQPGKILGPVGLKPGPTTFTIKVGEKSHDWTVDLMADERLVAVVTNDDKGILTCKPLTLPPPGEGKRQILRLPGTGSKEWKLGKTVVETGKPTPLSGKLLIKDTDGSVVVEGDSEESGLYAIAPDADDGKFVILFLP